jgi:hypothetical protein
VSSTVEGGDSAVKAPPCPHCGREAATHVALSYPQLRALRWCERRFFDGDCKPVPRRKTIISLVSRGLIDDSHKPTEAGHTVLNEQRCRR